MQRLSLRLKRLQVHHFLLLIWVIRWRFKLNVSSFYCFLCIYINMSVKFEEYHPLNQDF